MNWEAICRSQSDIRILHIGTYQSIILLITDLSGKSQLRDPFLDAQYRSQISKLGTTDAHAAGFEQLTPIFDEATMAGSHTKLCRGESGKRRTYHSNSSF